MKRIVSVDAWVESLNKAYADLIEKGLDPALRFIKLYPGAEEFYIEPEPGVTYEFDTDSKILKSVAVTLIRRVELAPEFKDALSEPYGCFDKETVRRVWGTPFHAKDPLVMPGPIGKTGGWDMYRLANVGLDEVELELVYSYTKDFVVSGFVLRVMENEG
jgi:hypothetical protein